VPTVPEVADPEPDDASGICQIRTVRSSEQLAHMAVAPRPFVELVDAARFHATALTVREWPEIDCTSLPVSRW
jgi:hypothetical protein